METHSLIPVEEIAIKYKAFKDPYTLAGDEKKECLEEMGNFIILYKKLENPTEEEKRLFFDACTKLQADAQRKIRAVSSARDYYEKLKNTLVAQELERFKVIVKLKFMEKYAKEMEAQTITSDMSKDLDKLTKMEKAACYIINGVDISLRDCATCAHKACNARVRE